ncbi:hypothetical protein [Methanosphaera stadtmanae]|uniref:hypothetical protein n=1 Tax=Methanosphaera stadtmanae TaxID=2317 RepID=UPI002591303A|nr:hypothetical protein [Methanosphaera stadtmanae]
MLFDDVWQHLEEGSNVLLYKQNIYQLFSENKGSSSWAFVSNPKKGKTAISDIVKVLVPGRVVKGLSVAELMDIIYDYARESEDMVVLWVDNFERLNKRTLEYYVELVSMANVYLVCNIVAEDEEFISPSFFDDFTFVILNSDEYSSSRAMSVNVKFTLLLLLSVFTFILFVRVQLSLVRYLVSALWFSLLMYRSFYYITR